MYGSGSIYWEPKRKRYVVDYSDAAGNRHKKRFAEKTTAEKFATAMAYRKAHEIGIPNTDIMVGEWLLEYLQVYVKSTVQLLTYKRYLESAARFDDISNTKLAKLQPATVQKLYGHLLETLSTSTVKKMHTVIKRAYKMAVQLRMVDRNPIDLVKCPKVRTKPIEIFTDDELHRITDVLKYSEFYKKYRVFFTALMLTGCRPGELMALETMQIKTQRHTVYFCRDKKNLPGEVFGTTKTAAGEREVPVPPAFIKQLLEVSKTKSSKPTSLVFHTGTGTAYCHTNLRRAWNKIAEKAGIENKTMYCFRHTYATRMLAKGVPVLEVARLMGHANPSHTYELYGHCVPGFNKIIATRVKSEYAQYI